ncbi:MAG: hypothetical protein EON86_12150 [Brevundimonas sp.]|nr:MAG: hypothetical protein EON86_12150 [Brevundimonas sp.]
MSEQVASLKAVVDNHGTKPVLKVSGSVLVHASDFTITVEEAVPQGFVPQELILDVTVDQRPSPMKGVMQPFSFSKVIGDIDYQSVRARFNLEIEDVVASVEPA